MVYVASGFDVTAGMPGNVILAFALSPDDASKNSSGH
jgi:hypothetical protein